MLDCPDILIRVAVLAQHSGGELGAAMDVGDGIFCACTFWIIPFLQVTSVVKKNSHDGQLEHVRG